MVRKSAKGTEEFESIDNYFLNKAAAPVIKEISERNRLALLAQGGDLVARDKLMFSFGRLIQKYTNSYFEKYKFLAGTNPAIWNKETVYSLVVEGFLIGINKFDPDRDNAALMTCCKNWVMCVVMREMERRLGDSMGVKIRAFRDKRAVEREIDLHVNKFGKEPSKEEIRQILGWGEGRFGRAWEALHAHFFSLVSGDDSGNEDGESIWGKISSDEDVFLNVESLMFEERVRKVLNSFKEGQKQLASDILEKRVLNPDGSRLKDIAEEHGICSERVRQVQVEIVEKLKVRVGRIIKFS